MAQAAVLETSRADQQTQATAAAGAAVQGFRQALAHEEAGHQARLERLQEFGGAGPSKRTRRGRVGQQARRQLEHEVRQQAVAFTRELLAGGGTRTEAAELLDLTSRTLRSWLSRYQADVPAVVSLGRPVLRPAVSERQRVLEFLKEQGATTSVALLQEQFPVLVRAEATELLQRYRRVLAERYPQTLRVLHWQVAGRVWALDFAEPSWRGARWSLPPVDGRFPYLLAVRDLASGYQLAWQPVADMTASVVSAVLARLFREQGVPLLLKVDNGPAFRADETKRFVAEAGAFLLYSPPHWPAYNGAIEAAIGSLKTRTERQAAAWGRSGLWTGADVAAALQQANTLTQPRRLRGRTPAEVWAGHSDVTPLERFRFQLAVERERYTARVEQRLAVEEDSDHWQSSAVDRPAMQRALVEHGYLFFTRRRIHLQVRSRKVTCA